MHKLKSHWIKYWRVYLAVPAALVTTWAAMKVRQHDMETAHTMFVLFFGAAASILAYMMLELEKGTKPSSLKTGYVVAMFMGLFVGTLAVLLLEPEQLYLQIATPAASAALFGLLSISIGTKNRMYRNLSFALAALFSAAVGFLALFHWASIINPAFGDVLRMSIGLFAFTLLALCISSSFFAAYLIFEKQRPPIM